MCKYENELNLFDTVDDGDDKFDVTESDYQDHTVMNVRKARRGRRKTYRENSTDAESTPKERPVKVNKTRRNVITKKGRKKNYFCPQCPKAYFYACHLRRHVEFECGKDYKFACPYCGKKNKRLDHCHRHIMRRHEGQPVYAHKLY